MADTYIPNVVQHGHDNDTDILYGVVRDVSKQVRDVANSNWEAFPGSGSLDDYDISAAAASGGLWSGDFPVEAANGFYIYQIRIRAGATPDYPDILVFSIKGYWNGAVFADIAGVAADVELITKVLTNKAIQNKSTGVITYYDDDGVTPILIHTPTDGESEITRTPS